ncbi:MAG: type restriction enzyme res subunit, partial [Paenibacillaceae bacterium]|nr:type restriction enzyme res subunit [Paenibacillaceae bacterium]
ENERLQAEIHRLQMENTRLLSEVAQLRRLLQAQASMPLAEGVATPTLEQETVAELHSEGCISYSNVTKESPIQDKIALFRSFFRGWEDVYALRGIDKAGKAGYFRARKYLGKENGKAVWGEDLPLTDEVIAQHLQREERPVTIGLYPLLTDETCWFLAVDFDKANWQEDCAAFLSICHEKNVPAALERSRSGNGGHVWIFFEERVAARTARKLGSTLLTLALEHRHQIGLDSYDRMFPNQDTLPRDKKLGNLIALPLQRVAGKAGNSLFIDANLQPYKDQWQFLASLRKIHQVEVEALVHEAERQGNVIRVAIASNEDDDGVEPWTITPSRAARWEGSFPVQMRLVISNMLYIEKEGLTSSQINYLIRMAAFQNPDFYKAQKNENFHLWQTTHYQLFCRICAIYCPAERLYGRNT